MEDAVESGADFERIIREACIEEMVPPRCREVIRKLKQQANLFRFPLDPVSLKGQVPPGDGNDLRQE